MSNDLANAKLVKVMTYGSSHVAHTAKGLLAENGITAQVQGDMIADAFSYYGSAVSKTDIVTLEADAEQALQILKQMELEAEAVPKGPWSDGPTLWLCDQCQEQNAHTFDQCWSCHADRPANPQAVPILADEDEPCVFNSELPFTPPVEEDQSPYRVPNSGTVTVKQERVYSANRALKVAVVSVVLFPVGFYGLYLTIRCMAVLPMSSKLVFCLLLNLLACLCALAMGLPLL